MLIKKKGNIVEFHCANCECVFVEGVKCVRTPDRGENYYCVCPCCGADCHADTNDLK